jgi:hypothetical protein
MAFGNTDFDALISTTLKKYRPKLEDNIFSDLPLLFWLREGDRIDRVDGGEQLVEPLVGADNSTAGSYAGYDSLSTTPQEGITAAVYDWRQFAVTVAISGIEEAKNNGESRVISLLQAKIEQAEDTAAEDLNTMFYADGTGNSSKDWLGLEHFVPDTAATLTVGGIDRSSSDNAWWRANVESTTEALTIARMSTMYNDCSKGRSKYKPDFIPTTQGLWEKYESLLQPQLRYQDTKMADAGFQSLVYRTAPVVWDEACTSTNMYFLTSKVLKLKVHTDVWFKPTPFEKPHGQDARYSQILSYGNLVSRANRNLGKLTNKS